MPFGFFFSILPTEVSLDVTQKAIQSNYFTYFTTGHCTKQIYVQVPPNSTFYVPGRAVRILHIYNVILELILWEKQLLVTLLCGSLGIFASTPVYSLPDMVNFRVFFFFYLIHSPRFYEEVVKR